jgi:DNA-binding beta-propeller fold protein YncE
MASYGAHITVGPYPQDVAVSPDGSQVYVTVFVAVLITATTSELPGPLSLPVTVA